jgi:Bifunctional DNA primase/polymerase, N-terminal
MAKVGPFAGFAPVYRQRGLWPRPITIGSKACHIAGWQRPDDEISAAALSSWTSKYGDLGIGLLMGTPFPDGTTLGAVDIDHDDYVGVSAALLNNPPSGRIGKKGAVFFVRVRGRLSNPEFRVAGKGDKVAESLFTKKLCVIPPTIHPDTGQAYRWIGTPLHEIDFRELPIVEMGDD